MDNKQTWNKDLLADISVPESGRKSHDNSGTTQSLLSSALTSAPDNSTFDQIYGLNSVVSPAPDDPHNTSAQLPPSYTSILGQTTPPIPPIRDQSSCIPFSSQTKLEQAHRALDFADYAWEKRNWPKAQMHYSTAAAIFRFIDDVQNEAHSLQRLGEACRLQRQFVAARAHLSQAHVLFGQCGDMPRQLMCERWIARVASDEGNKEEAQMLLHAALKESQSSRLRESEGWCLLRLGELQGNAEDFIAQALVIAQNEDLSLLKSRCISLLKPVEKNKPEKHTLETQSNEKQGPSHQEEQTSKPSRTESRFSRWLGKSRV